METKQTAVEWLYDEMKHIIPNGFLNKFEQAKAMEKEQMKDAYEADCVGLEFSQIIDKKFNKWYKKNYGEENSNE